MSSAQNSMLPPTPVPRDVREAVDRAIQKIGVSQAEAVRQGLRFGVGRYVEAMTAAQQRSPSNIRALMKHFPPLETPRDYKAAFKSAIQKKHGSNC